MSLSEYQYKKNPHSENLDYFGAKSEGQKLSEPYICPHFILKLYSSADQFSKESYMSKKDLNLYKITKSAAFGNMYICKLYTNI